MATFTVGRTGFSNLDDNWRDSIDGQIIITPRSAGFAGLILFALLFFASSAQALPRPASGSNCKSDWVNNEGAMQCFIGGEEDIRNGVKHPRYVACLPNGEVHCCRDQDSGGQNCEAVLVSRPPKGAGVVGGSAGVKAQDAAPPDNPKPKSTDTLNKAPVLKQQ
jgi:hypothetical protein